MSQRYFCPVEYTTKTKPKINKKTNPNPNPIPKKDPLSLGLGLVLGFGLVCTPLIKNIVGSSALNSTSHFLVLYGVRTHDSWQTMD